MDRSGRQLIRRGRVTAGYKNGISSLIWASHINPMFNAMRWDIKSTLVFLVLSIYFSLSVPAGPSLVGASCGGTLL
jgi:hypothetical protein